MVTGNEKVGKMDSINQEWCRCRSEQVTGEMVRLATMGPEAVVLCEVVTGADGSTRRVPILRQRMNKADITPPKV